MTPEERFAENIPLAGSVATRFWRTLTPWQFRCYGDDIRQEALIGLWHACQRYDNSRGVPFSSFAWPVIANQVGMYLRRIRPHIHPPYDTLSLEAICQDTDGLPVEGTLGYEPDLDAGLRYGELVRLIREVGGPEVTARLLCGLTAAEIARRRGVHDSVITRKYQEGVRRLRRALVG